MFETGRKTTACWSIKFLISKQKTNSTKLVKSEIEKMLNAHYEKKGLQEAWEQLWISLAHNGLQQVDPLVELRHCSPLHLKSLMSQWWPQWWLLQIQGFLHSVDVLYIKTTLQLTELSCRDTKTHCVVSMFFSLYHPWWFKG